MPQLRVQTLVLLNSFRRARLGREHAAGRRREPHSPPLPNEQPGCRSEDDIRVGTEGGKRRKDSSFSGQITAPSRNPSTFPVPPRQVTERAFPPFFFFSSLCFTARRDGGSRRSPAPPEAQSSLLLVPEPWRGGRRRLRLDLPEEPRRQIPRPRGRERLAPRCPLPGRRVPADPPAAIAAGEGDQEHARSPLLPPRRFSRARLRPELCLCPVWDEKGGTETIAGRRREKGAPAACCSAAMLLLA